MPRFTAKNKVTGETVSFDWDGDKPPAEDDVARISDQQREQRIALKQKVAKDNEQSFTERLMTSDASGYVMKGLNALGLNQPWHPIDAAKDVGSGFKQMITGSGAEANPRTAGLNKVVHGVMGVAGPPATAAGYAMAPFAMAGGMLAGNAASEGTRRGIETLAPETSPEVKDLASTGAGLVAGGLVGHGISSRMRNSTSSGPIKPTSAEVQAPRKVYGRWETPGGDNVGTIVNLGPRQLPPGRVEAPYTPQGPRAPVDLLPPVPEPSPVPQFNYGDRATLEGRPQAQLPEHGEPIPPPTVNYGRPPIQLPPAGTAAKSPLTIPPPQPITRPIQQLPNAPRPATVPLRPLQLRTPTIPGVEPPDVEMFKGVPQENIPKDLTSENRPEPISQSEVSTVQAPEVRSQGERTLQAVPPRAPVEESEPTPESIGRKLSPQIRQTSMRNPEAFELPQPTSEQLQQALAPPEKAPVVPIKPGPLGPPTQPQAPMSPPSPGVGPAAVPPKLPYKAPPPPMGPVTPPPAPTPTPISQRGPGPVAPMDIAKAALAKSLPPVKPINEPIPPSPPEAPEMPELSPEQIAAAKLNNDVVDFFKRRKDVTIDQLQRQFGVAADKARSLVTSLEKRGLIAKKGGKYNYIRARGEEAPHVPSDVLSPDEAHAALGTKAAEQLSPYRKQRMSSLHDQIGQAEDEGDTTAADILRDHLRTEERNAKIERTGTPEQKATVQSMDSVYQRIDALEGEEEQGDLAPEKIQELSDLYKKVNKLEEVVSKFMKSEGGQQGGDQPGPRRNILQRMSFIRNVEPPGSATIRDIRAFSAKLGSANRVLRESEIPGAVEIGKQTPLVEDLKHKFVGTYERRTASVIQDLPKQLRLEVGDILDRYQDPESARGYDPRSIKAAIDIRDILDEIHGMFPGGATRAGKDVGYIPNYLTHIEKTLESDSDFKGIVKDLVDYHLGPFKAIGNLFSREPLEGQGAEQPLGQYGVGKPNSPFVERRAGDLTNYERDIARVLPVYIESAAKVIYDKPWVDKAKEYLNQIPDNSKAKELATAYLRNYARYDAYPGLQQAWDTATGRIMRTVGRSILGFDTRLWTLHSARLFSNIFPELPMKYMAYGVAQVAKAPIESYSEVGRQGILPQNIRPWMFKRPMEKVDSISNALSIFDFIPDGIAYHGFKKMYIDSGYSPAEAGRMAANKTKDVSLRVTPARAAKFFSDDLGPLKPFTQFKQQVFKIAEQYATQPLDALKRAQYDRLSRYIIGVGSMMYMYKKFRISTWHLDPFHLSSFHAAAYERLGSILSNTYKSLNPPSNSRLSREDYLKKALTDAGLLMVPGGMSIKHQIEKGPSMFESDPQPSGTAPNLPVLH